MAARTADHSVTTSPGLARLIEQLDRARRRRGESKADVARGAGMGQPALRRLLSGRHANPTLRTVEAVAEHLGLRLTLEANATSPSDAPSLAEVQSRAAEIERIVEAHGGSNVRVFGSVARGGAHPGSDIDLLIDVAPGTGLLQLGAMEDELETLLGRRVDVVTSGHGPLRHLAAEAVPLR